MAGRGDYTGIVILHRPKRLQIRYVIAADLARRTPDQALAQIIADANPDLYENFRYAGMYRFGVFAIEGNHFQELMAIDLRRRSNEAKVRLPLWTIKNRSNKQSWIASTVESWRRSRRYPNRARQEAVVPYDCYPLRLRSLRSRFGSVNVFGNPQLRVCRSTSASSRLDFRVASEGWPMALALGDTIQRTNRIAHL